MTDSAMGYGKQGQGHVPRFMVVPSASNNGGTRLLSREANGARLDLLPLFREKGFELVSADRKYFDANVQAHGVSPTHHFLFKAERWDCGDSGRNRSD